MRITLTGFKCYQDKTLEIPDSNLILISGPSGIGKSTIFSAISWCLYGNQRNVDPLNSSTKSKLSVTLKWKDYTVYRQKRPNMLKLTFQGKNYEDAVAQSSINDIFGTPEIWPVVSYISQGCHNRLISASASDRIDIINTLTFTNENPEQTIERISQALRETTVKFGLLNDVYNRDLEELTAFLAQNEVCVEAEMSPIELQTLQDKIPQIQAEISRLQTLQLKSRESQGVIQTLRENLINFKTEFDKITLSTQDYETIISSLNRQFQLALQGERLRDEIANLESTLPSIDKTPEEIRLTQVTLQERITELHQKIQRQVQRETLVTELSNLRHSLPSVTKTPEEIQVQQERLQRDIHSLNDKIRLCVQREGLKSEITSLQSQLPQVSKNPEEIRQFQETLQGEITTLNYEIQRETHRQKLASELECLRQQLPKIPLLLSLEEVSREEERLVKYIHMSSLAAKYSLPYDKETISNLIHYDQRLIQAQPMLRNHERVAKLQSQIVPVEEVKISLSELKTKLSIMELSRDVLQCPHCNHSVRFQDKHLVLANESPVNQEEIVEVSQTIHRVESLLRITTENERIKAEIAEIPLLPVDPSFKILPESVIKSMYQRMADLSQIEFIDSPRITREQIVDLRKFHSLDCRIRQLEIQISEFCLNCLDTLKTRLNQVQSDFRHSQEQLNAAIQYKILQPQISQRQAELCLLPSDELEPLQREFSLNQAQSQNLRHELEQVLKFQSISLQISHRECQLVTWPTEPLDRLKAELEQQQLSAQNSQIELNLASKFQILNDQIRHKKNELERIQITEPSSQLKTRLDKVLTESQEAKITQARHTLLQREISQIEARISYEESNLVVVDDTLLAQQNELEILVEKIEQAKIANYALSHGDELAVKREQLLELETRLNGLEQLKRLAIEVEHLTLQNVIDSINSALADIGSSLFDEPISIMVQLFKTTKTTGQTKPSVNLLIHYKGGEYTSVSELSGGEADRVSLALTLALSRLSTSPILLFDESLASLNPDIKELCTKAIRQYAGDKTVICINHECVEGHYDYILSL